MQVILPDLAPAYLTLVSFFITATVFFIVYVWQVRRIRLTQSAVIRVVGAAVDDLSAGEVSTVAKEASLRTQIGYVVLACALFTPSYLLLYLVAGSGVRIIWLNSTIADKRLADSGVSILLLLVESLVVLPLIERRLILSERSRRLATWEFAIWQSLVFAQWVALFTVFVAAFMVLGFRYGWLAVLAAYLIYYFIALAPLKPFGKSVLGFPHYWVQSALARADYKEALRRVQHLENRLPQDAGILYNHGTILLFAGRFVEAEKFLRRSLVEAQKNVRFLPAILTNLGYALLRQGRYLEAKRALQGAVKLNPKSGHAYAGLAEIYLFQRIEPQQALQLTADFIKRNSPHRSTDRSMWGAILGDEAWALALLGHQADAERSLKQAFEMTDKKFRPGLAGLHFRAGQTMRLQNAPERAVSAFERAIQLDPEGAFGQFSRQALQEIDSSE